MKVQPRDSIGVLERRIKGERDGRVRDRLRAVVLAKRGRAHEPIAEQLSMSPRWVEKWVARYNHGGVAALRDGPRSGQPTKLKPSQVEAFTARLGAGPTEADGGVCTLRGQDIRSILQREFGARYALSGVYELLDRLGYSCLRPRPRHRKNDPVAMDAFTHRAPFFSRASATTTPTRRSRSGSRTRPASASRGR
jgi:transposase